MADIGITVDAKAINKVLSDLKRPNKARPLLDQLGGIMVADTMLNFRQQQSPDGVPWEPLKPATLKRRRKGKGGNAKAQILRDTSILRNSITYAVGMTPGDEYVEIGTNVKYARAHQEGRPEINLPARPYLGIGPRATNKINKAIQAWADALLEAAGGS